MNKIKKLVVFLMAAIMVATPTSVDAALYEHYMGTYHTSTYFDSTIYFNSPYHDWEGGFYYDGPAYGNVNFQITNEGSETMYYMIFDASGNRIAYSSIPPYTGYNLYFVLAKSNAVYRMYMFEEGRDAQIGSSYIHILYKWSD